MRDEHPDLFHHAAAHDLADAPLAERMRPRTLAELRGQNELLGPDKVLRRAIEEDRIPSMILWGPPGSGKTTVARIIARETSAAFETLSATSSGVKEIRAVVERACSRRAMQQRKTVLFIDEIHRFNKAQQDALLPHVEDGLLRLVGATTENPSFEVNSALLSRARVFRLEELPVADLVEIMREAVADHERGLGRPDLEVADDVLEAIADACEGDARRALTALELAVSMMPTGTNRLDGKIAAQAMGRRSLRYDKRGEEHYNVVSAFIKSMRASDPDASVYWLARMLEAGEDPMFVARRIVIFAAEDVGNADPQALVIAQTAADATHLVGMPEAVLPLSQATLYMALATKSNSSLRAYEAARADVERHGALAVPLDVRNAVTRLMKSMGYGAGYRYPHDTPSGVDADHGGHLPASLQGRRYVEPSDRGWEGRAWQRLVEQGRTIRRSGPREDG